jgi:hypothetical protein
MNAVASCDFAAEWERCKAFLEPACDDGWTIEDVEREIRARRATFWPLEHSAGVTQVQTRPSGRVLLIWMAGGELDELLCHLPAMENFARVHECTSIEVNGRPGWERVMSGYRKHAVVLVREI